MEATRRKDEARTTKLVDDFTALAIPLDVGAKHRVPRGDSTHQRNIGTVPLARFGERGTPVGWTQERNDFGLGRLDEQIEIRSFLAGVGEVDAALAANSLGKRSEAIELGRTPLFARHLRRAGEILVPKDTVNAGVHQHVGVLSERL